MSEGGIRPLVSVVIPCYNQGCYLGDAVRSASAHAVRVEVIVIDDGSTDHTAAVARSLPNVLLVRQNNRGLAAARNRGLRAASGDFVVFLDADDRLLAGAIDLGARVLLGNADCAMAYGRCVMMSADGRLLPTPDVPVVRSGHHAAFLQTNFIWMPGAAIFRRDALIAAGGFREGFDGAADYDLYLRISRTHGVHDHGQPVAAYRRHEASMSSSSGAAARMLRDTLTVMQRNEPPIDSEFHRAWRDGYARWQDFYGTQLVEEIRCDVHTRFLAEAWRKTLVLARLAPAIMARELRRAARRRYAGRAIPAAEISAPSRRAET